MKSAQITSARRHHFSNQPWHLTGIGDIFCTHGPAIVEWGLPAGRSARLIPLLLIKHFPAFLWIYGRHWIYPPTWRSHGIDLNKAYFIQSALPVKQLKPIFLEDTFKMIVLDSPKILTKGELAFITAQTRVHQQTVFIIRPYFLNTNKGNAFASIRINGAKETDHFWLQIIKGKKIQRIVIPFDALVYEH